MSCTICGKTSCTESFHSLEDQNTHQEKIDSVKDGIKRQLLQDIKSLSTYDHGDMECVELIKVQEIIEYVLW